jgi:hypothetical protein
LPISIGLKGNNTQGIGFAVTRLQAKILDSRFRAKFLNTIRTLIDLPTCILLRK